MVSVDAAREAVFILGVPVVGDECSECSASSSSIVSSFGTCLGLLPLAHLLLLAFLEPAAGPDNGWF